jgi:hypothetical protein
MRNTRSIVIALAVIALPGALSAQADPAQIHVRHVLNEFTDTPNKQGLLTVALADARVAAQHASLAGRNTTNLEALKLHAGHILHAVDPAEGSTGPGSGYGVKKASAALATHIEMAGRAAGAPAPFVQHAPHVATAARNTVTRIDNIVSLAKRMQAATSAAEAAAILAEMTPVVNALIAGVDTNGNGTVEWRQGEGGLAQAEEHVKNMMAGGGA